MCVCAYVHVGAYRMCMRGVRALVNTRSAYVNACLCVRVTVTNSCTVGVKIFIFRKNVG